MAPKIETTNVFDVFQPGLRRGAERLPFDPRKEYFYVEHPEEGWRVYLRAACFIHEVGVAFDPTRFLVVKRTGGEAGKKTWEPPKGQMEGRDGGLAAGASGRKRSILQLLKENVRREVAEEAKVENIRGLAHTGLTIQAVEPDFPPNTYFQYHIFSGWAHPLQLQRAFDRFAWLAEHPAEFRRLRADQREKDGLGWYNEGTKRLMGRWSPTLVRLYLEWLSPR
jgi:hypothetical protein